MMDSKQSLVVYSDQAPTAAFKRDVRTQQLVLSEETYTETLSRLIQRDFFPDLPILKKRLELMNAIESKDPRRILSAKKQLREALLISTAASMTPLSSLTSTPALSTATTSTFMSTPILLTADARSSSSSSSSLKWPPAPPSPSPATTPSSQSIPASRTSTTATSAATTTAPNIDSNSITVPDGTQISLDDLTVDGFLSTFTSEDNASFSVIFEKMQQQQRERYQRLRDIEEKTRAKDRLIQLEGPTATSGAGAGRNDSPATPDSWPSYTSKNTLFFPPDEKSPRMQLLQQLQHQPQQQQQQSLMMLTDESSQRTIDSSGGIRIGNPKEISHGATRFDSSQIANQQKHPTPLLSSDQPDGSSDSLPAAAAIAMSRVELLGRSPGPQSSPQVQGFGFVATPSPAPGIDEDPFMTWGEIEGTPLLLDPSQTPLQISASGPQFRLPDTPSRELIARNLADKVTARIRAQQRHQRNILSNSAANLTPHRQSPYSRPTHTPIRDRIEALSPAARHLLGATLKRKNTDSSGRNVQPLGASFQSDPKYRIAAPSTPKLLRRDVSSSSPLIHSRTAAATAAAAAAAPTLTRPVSFVPSSDTAATTAPTREGAITDDLLDLNQ